VREFINERIGVQARDESIGQLKEERKAFENKEAELAREKEEFEV